jgi:hypothetical protein
VQSFHAPRLVAAFGWSYLILGALVTATVATGGAWLHQIIVRRFTFALFRLYAAVVSAGIGSVFGWCLGWWLLLNEVQRHALPWWICGMLILMVAFGAAAYRGAHKLRGEAPTSFTWISAEEFAGREL